jgi:L-cysteine S-thiosulfotransferase
MTSRQRMRVPLLAAAMAAFALGHAQAASPDAVKLVNQQCQQCHEIKGIGDFGNVGPSLVGLKERFPDRKDVAEIIYDETKRNPLTAMPPFGRNLILDKQQIDTIVDYLYNQ